MEIILLERIPKLGQMGDVVNVKDGFARNYLLPQKKALRANSENKKRFEESKVQLEADNLKLREEAEKVSKTITGIFTVIIRQASETGQLYGSVTARDISKNLKNDGISISRKQVKLLKTIKQLGIFKTEVVLHPEVSAMINVNVARSSEEADIQTQGKDPNMHEKQAVSEDNTRLEVSSDFFETEEAASKAKEELEEKNVDEGILNEEN